MKVEPMINREFVSFARLTPGDTFKIGCEYFIVTPTIVDEVGGKFNAVNLKLGTFDYIYLDTMVDPIKLKAVLDMGGAEK